MLIGSHVSLAAPDFYLATVKEALSYGASTFMFYTGAPQNTRRLPLDKLKIAEGRALIKEKGLDEDKIIVHAPYIINLGNTIKPEVKELADSFLVTEIKRVEAFSLTRLVLHPGAGVGALKEEAIKAIAEGLDQAFEKTEGSKVKVLLETMAGKGTEIGASFSEIKEIISLSKYPERLGVCLDTCHIHDAGYLESDIDKILDEFDREIGLDKLLAIHLNDSKNDRGSHKDRHENIGYGDIGFKTLRAWAVNERLKDVPKILETPWVDGKAPYQKEIEMLKTGIYEENWKESL